MAKKQTKTFDASKYLKKDSAYLLAGACLLVGFFIGLNLSGFLGKKSDDPVNRLPNPAQVQTQQQEADNHAEFDRLLAAAEADPDNPEGWTILAHAYFDADHYQEAITAYEKSLALDSSNADVWTDLGVMYRRSGQPERAVECFDRAMLADPGHATSRFNKGIVLLHDLGDKQGALESWRELVKINPMATTPTGQPMTEFIKSIESGN